MIHNTAYIAILKIHAYSKKPRAICTVCSSMYVTHRRDMSEPLGPLSLRFLNRLFALYTFACKKQHRNVPGNARTRS